MRFLSAIRPLLGKRIHGQEAQILVAGDLVPENVPEDRRDA
jgi:hypothetical protein